jgi:hypothetical protein
MASPIARTSRHTRRFAEARQMITRCWCRVGVAESTKRVIAAIQADGACWCGGAIWQEQTDMRISVSSWATTDKDVERSLAVMLWVAARHSAKRG